VSQEPSAISETSISELPSRRYRMTARYPFAAIPRRRGRVAESWSIHEEDE